MKTRYNILFILPLLLSGLVQSAWAQRQADNWFFGLQASLEFSGGKPASFYNSVMQAPAGSASISDKQGNLLFYTNGETIWNRLHQPMSNGTGLLGSANATQSSLIVPHPGNDSLYYVFTTDQNTTGISANGVRFSVVNMKANFGMGTVLSGGKNTVLTAGGPVSEKLAGVHHFNNQDVWVLTHLLPASGTQEFRAYRVTAAGVTLTPVISSMPALPTATAGGYLKISPVGNKLAACFIDEGFQLFDFDNKTGVVSNPETLHQLQRATNNFYGAEFSPNGQMLYLAFTSNPNSSFLWQYNLAAGSITDIIDTRLSIHQTMQVSPFDITMAMQLSNNGKIYLTRANTSVLTEIANPNGLGFTCDLKVSAVLPHNFHTLASGSLHGFGLPNFIQSYFAPPRFRYTGICAESPTVFTIINSPAYDSVRWNFNDPASNNLNTSKQAQPAHTFNLPGDYQVTLTLYSQGQASVFERQVTILNKPLVQLPRDTTICEGTALTLMNAFPHSPFNERFRWSTGDTVAAIVVTKPGIYWLELKSGQCSSRDSIQVFMTKPPEVDLGDNFETCGNGSVVLDAGNPGATYLWQPGGETTQTITVNKTGTYKVTVTAKGCSATDSKSVIFRGMTDFDLGNDLTLCEGEKITLKAGAPPSAYTTYLWSDGSQRPELNVTQSGKYWVMMLEGKCVFTDTINVTFNYCPPPPQPYIPNIITPNGDNLNDKLVSLNLPEGNYTLKVYNRWGVRVFEQKNYRNEWPQGKIAHGTYYYIFEHQESGKLFKGWVEVAK